MEAWTPGGTPLNSSGWSGHSSSLGRLFTNPVCVWLHESNEINSQNEHRIVGRCLQSDHREYKRD